MMLNVIPMVTAKKITMENTQKEMKMNENISQQSIH